MDAIGLSYGTRRNELLGPQRARPSGADGWCGSGSRRVAVARALGEGIHFGAVVEGVLGGAKSKAYDAIGDTINTAQRLCDAAAPWEVLLSESVLVAANYQAQMQRTIQVKGKKAALNVGVIACL